MHPTKKATFAGENWNLLQGVPSGHRHGFVDLDLNVPPSAQLLLGWWELGRSCLAVGKDDGTIKSKSTQPRSVTKWDTLNSRFQFQLDNPVEMLI